MFADAFRPQECSLVLGPILSFAFAFQSVYDVFVVSTSIPLCCISVQILLFRITPAPGARPWVRPPLIMTSKERP